ncbi:MAG: quinol:cytochrome C oxidoreductase [Acidobacteria bacterium]|nr:quinol:cytochrome C oxidoreductase [Acidobacteriota bacterium]
MSQAHHHANTDSYYIPDALWERGRNVIGALFLLGWSAALAGFAADHSRFYQGYLVAFFFGFSITIGASLFTMIQHLTGSAWSVPVRRIMENIMMSFPVLALLFIPVALGVHSLYEWSHAEFVAKEVLELKKGVYSAYLNEKGFLIRAGIFFAVWSFWAWRLYSNSKSQDATHAIDPTLSNERWSAPGMLLFFLSASLASVDWVMSLNPHWFSTMFGVYCMAGGAWGFWALLTFIFLRFRANGIMTHSVTTEHYHDLGKWMFAMTVFWAYIAFCQYMLIWYANMPEETIFFKVRREGSWETMSGVLLFGHFILTFLVLLARNSKRTFNVLRFATVWVLAMHYTDVYWLVMPNFSKGIAFHWVDAAALVAVMSTMALAFWLRLKNAPIAPIGDPRFKKGLEFQNV